MPRWQGLCRVCRKPSAWRDGWVCPGCCTVWERYEVIPPPGVVLPTLSFARSFRYGRGYGYDDDDPGFENAVRAWDEDR